MITIEDLKSKDTVRQAVKYAESHFKQKEYENNEHVEQVLLQYIKEQSGLSSIPEQYQSRVYDYVRSYVSPDEYYPMYRKLLDLVCIFDPNEDQPQSVADQYEYGISYFDDYPCEENGYKFDLIQTLNDFGKSGWEIFSLTERVEQAAYGGTTSYYTAQMKRKITNQ